MAGAKFGVLIWVLTDAYIARAAKLEPLILKIVVTVAFTAPENLNLLMSIWKGLDSKLSQMVHNQCKIVSNQSVVEQALVVRGGKFDGSLS